MDDFDVYTIDPGSLSDTTSFNSLSSNSLSSISHGYGGDTVFDDTTISLSPAEEDPYLYGTGSQSFEVPFFITVCIFGVIGNLIVVAVYRQKQYRHSNAALYILNLAAGDLFLLLGVVLFHITEYYPRSWSILWRTDIQCILHRFGRFTGMNITIFTMIAIAFDRYVAVVHAIEYKRRCPVERTKGIILCMWIASAVAAGPSVINFATKYGAISTGENYAGKTPFACRILYIGPFYDRFKMVYISTLLYIPAAITLVVYMVIVVYVWRNSQQFRGSLSTRTINDKRRSYWKTTQVLLVVFSVFAVTYGLLATCTLALLIYPALVPGWAKNVGLLLPYANTCVNPILYSLINPRFRTALWTLVASKLPKDRRKMIEYLTNGNTEVCSKKHGNMRSNDNQLPLESRNVHERGSSGGISNQAVVDAE